MSYCEICSNETKEGKNLCPICENKRKCTRILLELQKNVDFKENISNTFLFNLGYTNNVRRIDMIWTLQETNMIRKLNNNEYTWVELEEIEAFVKKYDENQGIYFKINSNLEKQQRLCKRCGNPLTNTNKKQKFCKNCKKINKTLKNIKFITQYENPININNLIQKTSKESYQIEDIVYNLIENNLIKKIDDENYQLKNKEIKEYLQKYDVSESENIKTKNKKEKYSEDVVRTVTQIIGKTLEPKENKPIEQIISKKEKPDIFNIKPSGYVLYNNTSSNNTNIEEYHLLTLAKKNKTDNELSKVFILNDFDNVKWIEKINSYYVYNENQKSYVDVTLYKSDELLNNYITLYDVKEFKEQIKNETKDISEDKKEKIELKNKKEDLQISNMDIFNEFFEKHIYITTDDEWITNTQLYEILKKYALEKYQVTIKEFGVNGFNSLFSKKQEKISYLRIRNNEGRVEYNLKYLSEFKEKSSEINEDNVEEKEYDTNNKLNEETRENSKIISKDSNIIEDRIIEFFDNNITIIKRDPNINDITENELFKYFNNYSIDKYNEEVNYTRFSLYLHKLLEERNIKSKIYNMRKYYNLRFNKLYKENYEEEKEKTINFENITEKSKTEIPETIKKIMENKNTNTLNTDTEQIMIYNEIINQNRYSNLIILLDNMQNYIDKINITRITKEKYNVNIELRIKK